ncbi:MAG: cation transporter [Deltaproteobacteria bacterium]|nr:cation transporter [Deltaproteobacteria bacterium]RKX27861.1 MAG: cation transporter [candidate division Zixibacteria bacterium]
MSEFHKHSNDLKNWGRAFAFGIGLNVIFVVVEIIFGLVANSSALLADAGHNASDVLSLVFAWAAIWIATKKPAGKYTYGLRRTTILASLLNAMLILAAAGLIAWHAVEKIRQPAEVASMIIVVVAGIGVVINTFTALLFIKGQKEDLNIKGAFFHMAADAIVSLGVVLAGLAIRYTGANWVDPLISLAIVAVIVYGTWGLLRDSVNLALDAVPKNVDIVKIRSFLEHLSGVEDVHDLHVWGLSTSETAMTVHIVAPDGKDDEFIFKVQNELQKNYGIDHITLQIETKFNNQDKCGQCIS